MIQSLPKVKRETSQMYSVTMLGSLQKMRYSMQHQTDNETRSVFDRKEMWTHAEDKAN